MVLFIIAGTMAFPFCIQIDHRDHFGLLVALGKNDSYLLRIGRPAFQGIAGTTAILQIAFAVIDMTILHDIFHFGAVDMTAIHPAKRMLAVFQKRDAAVKAPVSVDTAAFFLPDLILPGPVGTAGKIDRKQEQAEKSDQQVREPFFLKHASGLIGL
jgi:hypothetical protein